MSSRLEEASPAAGDEQGPFKSQWFRASLTPNREKATPGCTPIKICFVGDGAVGKTSLLMAIVTSSPPGDYIPNAYDVSCLRVDSSQGLSYEISLWDSVTREDYDRLRPLSYPGTNVFIICFSLISPTSYENVRTKWKPEVQHTCPDSAIILVGTKVDLRKTEATNGMVEVLPSSSGHELAQKIGAVLYLETSAITGSGLEDLILNVLKFGVRPEDQPLPGQKQKPRSGGCLLQ